MPVGECTIYKSETRTYDNYNHCRTQHKYYCNSTRKKISEDAKLNEINVTNKCVNVWTTGNSNAVIQTRSTYMTVWQILLQYSDGFSTRASSQKVSTSDCNIERQTEMGIRSPKSEAVSTTTITDGVEIPTASSGFSTTESLDKVSPSDSVRQTEMTKSPPKPKILITLELCHIRLEPQAVAVTPYGWLTTHYGWLAGLSRLAVVCTAAA